MSKLVEKNVINHGECNPCREVKAFEPGREGFVWNTTKACPVAVKNDETEDKTRNQSETKQEKKGLRV